MKWALARWTFTYAALVAFVVSSCSQDTSESVVAPGAAETTADGVTENVIPPPDDAFPYLTPEERPSTGIVADGNYWGINELVSMADHAVIATVVESGEPVWTGKAYSVMPDGRVSPLEPHYRRNISLKVDEVVFSNSLKAGTDVTVLVDGTGKVGGYPIGFPNLQLTIDEIVPTINAGETVVVLLTEGKIPTEAGDIDGLQPTAGSYLSVWVVGTDGIARNLDPTRDLQVDRLIERLNAERKAGIGQPTSADALQEPYAPDADGYAPDPLATTSLP